LMHIWVDQLKKPLNFIYLSIPKPVQNNLNPPNLLIDRSFIFMIGLPLLDNKATFPVYIWSFIFIICLSLLKQQSHFPVYILRVLFTK
jgi:hypothetical protein